MSEASISTIDTGLTRLREAFPAETIGKLPKVTCRDCSDKDKTCSRHAKKKCDGCGAFISESHVHIDFVGHAPVTDRLLNVDPHWNWEPYALGADGMPAVVKNDRGVPIGMWIKLTVLGVTRPGYGSCLPGPEATKELIGDAIRNAAMRFGVALDLWSKTELESQRAEVAAADYDGRDAPVAPAKRTGGETLARARSAVQRAVPTAPPLPADEPTISTEEADELKARLNALDGPARAAFKAEFGHPAHLLADKLTSAREFVAGYEVPATDSRDTEGGEQGTSADGSHGNDQPGRLVTAPAPNPGDTDRHRKRVNAAMTEVGVRDDDERHALIRYATGGYAESSAGLNAEQVGNVVTACQNLSNGFVVFRHTLDGTVELVAAESVDQ